MKKKLIVLSGFALSFAPVVVLAATLGGCSSGNDGTLGGVLCKIDQLLNAVIPVLISLAVVYFVWGVISYVIGDDQEAKKKGRDRIIFGILGLAVIIALWGLVRILTKTFGVDNAGQNITLPSSVNFQ